VGVCVCVCLCVCVCVCVFVCVHAQANRVNVVRQILAWVSTVDTTAPKAA